jgi:hypothetical protein
VTVPRTEDPCAPVTAFAPVILCLAICTGGCAAVPAANDACHDGERRITSDVLYFGTATPEGRVTAAQWKQFIDDIVTPRFPQGLTAWPAAGQWRSADGTIVHEASNVLALIHAEDRQSDASVTAIIDAYKSEFHQEAVLRVRSPSCASP